MPSQHRIVAALILIGILVQIAIAPWWGHPGDINHFFVGWAEAIQQHGWINVYQTSSANYPPLSMALIGAAAWLEGIFGTGLSPEANLRLWRVLFKLPGILAAGGIALAVWHITGRRREAWRLVAAVIFNPVLFYLSAVWGQMEALYGLAILLSVWLAVRGHSFWAGICLGLGVLVKFQTLVAAPVVGLATLALIDRQLHVERFTSIRRRLAWRDATPVLRLALGFALPLLIGFLPFIVTGQLPDLPTQLTAFPDIMRGWLSINAHNLWFLGTAGAGNWRGDLRSTDLAAAGLTFRTLGRLLVLAWTAFVCGLAWSARRDRVVWFLAGALLYLGLFLLSTGVTERYMFGAVPLLAGAVAVSLRRNRAADPALARAFVMASIFHALNLIWAAPALDALNPWFGGNAQTGTVIALGLVVTAAIATGLLLRRVPALASARTLIADPADSGVAWRQPQHGR